MYSEIAYKYKTELYCVKSGFLCFRHGKGGGDNVLLLLLLLSGSVLGWDIFS